MAVVSFVDTNLPNGDLFFIQDKKVKSPGHILASQSESMKGHLFLGLDKKICSLKLFPFNSNYSAQVHKASNSSCSLLGQWISILCCICNRGNILQKIVNNVC